MNALYHPLAAALLALLLAAPPAAAAPGAHGPNGEHLDAPAALHARPGLPRMDAQTEAFELVAELRPAELVVVVDRHDTNEPVLGATLEVDSGGLKAVAAFRPEQGDYVVTDAAMLKRLAAAGEHGLVFTLVVGAETDLLDGTLAVGAGRAGAGVAAGGHGHGSGGGSGNRNGGDDHGHDHGHDHDHDHPGALERAAWIGAGIAALGLVGGIAWRRRRRSSTALPAGGL